MDLASPAVSGTSVYASGLKVPFSPASATAQNTKLYFTVQINRPTRYNNFSILLLDVYLQLNMFRAKHVEL